MRTYNIKDLTGQRFGRWTVLKRAENNKGKHPTWLCKCDCGGIESIKKVIAGTLKSGLSKSCGCLHAEISRKRLLGKESPQLINITGQTFGRLTVLKRHSTSKKGGTAWLCQCSCYGPNSLKVVNSNALRRCMTRSCGCLLSEVGRKKIQIFHAKSTHADTTFLRLLHAAEVLREKPITEMKGL